MSQKNAKKLRRLSKDDLVYLDYCDNCGDFIEINKNDDFALFSALQNNSLVVMFGSDFENLIKKEV
jgi:hypothetical protein